jgi:hypothetical protein
MTNVNPNALLDDLVGTQEQVPEVAPFTVAPSTAFSTVSAELLKAILQNDQDAIQTALDIRQELAQQVAPTLRQIKKLEDTLKELAKDSYSNQNCKVGLGNTMQVSISYPRKADPKLTTQELEALNLDPSDYYEYSVKSVVEVVSDACFLEGEKVVRVTFK